MRDVDPAALDAVHAHRLMTGLLVPRPIAFVGTVSPAGVTNVAPFSFANGIASKPPVLMVALTPRRDGTPKDTLRNAVDTGEFTVNIVDEALMQAMHDASAPYPPDVSEFDALGIGLRPSVRIRAPGVDGAPATFECRLRQVIPVEGTTATMLLGDVLLYRVRDDLLDAEGFVDVARMGPVGRLGPDQYTVVRDVKRLAPVRTR